MKLLIKQVAIFFIIILLNSQVAVAKGGDDAGNGGFAYKQSDKILKMATDALHRDIPASTLDELVQNPDWRGILFTVLKYDNLQKLYNKNASRGGMKLAMDYVVTPPSVKILQPYYEAFMGKLDSELEESTIEVEKRLLHEAAHIWGFNESDAEKFAIRFLNSVGVNSARVSNDITFKNNYCSCLNGKSDLINECDNFCAGQTKTSVPTLYLDAILGDKVLKNKKIKTLDEWCNLQLDNDNTKPQCYLTAWDGQSTLDNIPVSISNNKVQADLSQLSYNTTYVVKLYEGKTGSNAETKEIQIRRVPNVDQKPPTYSSLKISPASQYSCLFYEIENNKRIGFNRKYYYYPANDLPAPIPTDLEEQIVCHDEQMYGSSDSALYPRLELITGRFTFWDITDPRFNEVQGKRNIDQIIETRLHNEFGINATLNLFSSISFENRPNSSSSPLGLILNSFVDTNTGNAICPDTVNYQDHGKPIFRILYDYMADTEGLYIAESSAESIYEKNSINISQFITETNLLKFGFFIENGLKVRATSSDLHQKSIFYYYPYSDSIDPLIQGDRKLFAVKFIDQIHGFNLEGIKSSVRTSDKRIGCIPRTIGTISQEERENGSSCTSDFQCESLCCNSAQRTCAPHIPKGPNPMFCSKQVGEQCVSNKYCAQASVLICNLYKNGYNPDGTLKCVVRCPTVNVFGSCENGVCIAPVDQTDTSNFDLLTCKGALDPKLI